MDWDAAWVRFWNTAVRNSSALRVALTRLCKDEIAREMAGICWEIEKVLRLHFPLMVMKEMVASAFNPVFLALSVQFHLRILRRHRHHSLPMAESSSIRAGVMESGLCANMDPAVGMQDFVDDLAQRGEHKVASGLCTSLGDGAASYPACLLLREKVQKGACAASSSRKLSRRNSRQLGHRAYVGDGDRGVARGSGEDGELRRLSIMAWADSF